MPVTGTTVTGHPGDLRCRVRPDPAGLAAAGPACRGAGAAAQQPGPVLPGAAREPGTNGRPARHGAVLKLADQQSWPDPPVTTVTETTRYGTATATAWSQLHQRLTGRAGWEDHDGELPVIEGTLIRLRVSRLPGNRSPEPLWLWTTTARLDDRRQPQLAGVPAPVRIEHTFRPKQAADPPKRGPGGRRPGTWTHAAHQPRADAKTRRRSGAGDRGGGEHAARRGKERGGEEGDSDQYAYARSMPSGCVSGRHALSKSVNVPGLIRRVVIQTNCSSIVASSRTDAVVATGTAAGRDPRFCDYSLSRRNPDGWRPWPQVGGRVILQRPAATARSRRQKRTTALMTAMYRYSGRLITRWARNRGCQAANGA